jgi:hypothetical protein
MDMREVAGLAAERRRQIVPLLADEIDPGDGSTVGDGNIDIGCCCCCCCDDGGD